MIFRTYLGLDISATRLCAVALRRKGSGSVLSGGRVMPLPATTLVPSVRNPHIQDTRSFIEGLHEVLAPLAGAEERLALSLPEAGGRLVLMEIEAAFKSKREGIDILRWQLKNQLPIDPRELHLDYQILEKRDNGRYRVAVAMAARKIVNQYEELLTAAGYNPTIVDFHALNLYNYYRPRLDLGEDFVLVCVEERTLSLQFFQGGILTFFRARPITQDPASVFQELNRTLVNCQSQHPGFKRAAAFLHCTWEDQGALLEALNIAFQREVAPMNPHLDRLAQAPLGLPAWQLPTLAAAVGAAERLM